VVSFSTAGAVAFEERTRLADGSVSSTVRQRFQVDSLGAAA
jgi:hypothetical protein